MAERLGAFLSRYDRMRDRALSGWSDGHFLGAIFIDGCDAAAAPGWAHLRWFIARQPRQGLGRRLLDEALAFSDGAGYRGVCLDTFAGLDPARRLYERAGFRLTAETVGRTWGAEGREQRFERRAPES